MNAYIATIRLAAPAVCHRNRYRIRGRLGSSRRMHEPDAHGHDRADLDARADLDSHLGADLDSRANMDTGPDLHAYARAYMDSSANADRY